MDRAERLLNLMMYLLGAGAPVTAEDVQNSVSGYDPDASDDAFGRMFERDKDDLRKAGVPIAVTENEWGDSAYEVDRRAYYLAPLSLTPAEMTAARIVAEALGEESGFPMVEDLRLAVLKLSSQTPAPRQEDTAIEVRLGAEAQADRVRRLYTASRQHKRVSFTYQAMSTGETAERTVEPYGLFYTRGAWYLLGRDVAREDLRTFRVSRIAGPVDVNAKRPHQPDFEVPPGFDIREHGGRPWEIGPKDVDATVRFDADIAWLAEREVAGSGTFTIGADGRATWEVEGANEERLVRWLLGLGTKAELVAPTEARARLASALSRMTRPGGSA